jgi:hypothetical protein
VTWGPVEVNWISEENIASIFRDKNKLSMKPANNQMVSRVLLYFDFQRATQRFIPEYVTLEHHAFLILTPDGGYWISYTSQPLYFPPQGNSPGCCVSLTVGLDNMWKRRAPAPAMNRTSVVRSYNAWFNHYAALAMACLTTLSVVQTTYKWILGLLMNIPKWIVSLLWSVARRRLVETENLTACATVNCKACKSAIAL